MRMLLTMEPGSWAEWATAIVALLALVAAVWAGRAAWAQNQATLELLKVERQREDRAAGLELGRAVAEERAHQADQVAVWVTYGNPEASAGSGFFAEIHNQSRLPIYDVEVTFLTPDEQEWVAEGMPLGVVPPGSLHVPVPEILHRQIYAAEEGQQPNRRYPQQELLGKLRARIRFRDSADRKWQRGGRGLLTRIYDAGT
jgi:hypothetical protein